MSLQLRLAGLEMCMLAARVIYGLVSSVAMVHIQLLFFAVVPAHLVVLGLCLQVVYLVMIRQMSKIQLMSPLSIIAIGNLRFAISFSMRCIVLI